MSSRRKINSILFVLDGYPIRGSKSCVFARNLIVALADMGIKCTVIAPQIITRNSFKRGNCYCMKDITPLNNEIVIYEPYYLHLSSRRSLLGYSMRNHTKTVERVIEKEGLDFDAVYGHFIYQCGLTAAAIGELYNVPSFLGAGESDKLLPDTKRCRGAYQTGLTRYNWAERLEKLSGIICVSEWTCQLLIDGGFVGSESRYAVFPNGVDQKRFYPGSKKEARNRLKINETDFVICFVGSFDNNKGAERVVRALEMINEPVKAIFIGRDGPQRPIYAHALFVGQCENNIIPEYLRASDCFVLPTRNEGCCNAILEALACGVPVISSDLPFNDGILDHTNSIRINPNDVESIARAISYLKENPSALKSLAEGAKECSEKFDIINRAKKIYSFMENMKSD